MDSKTALVHELVSLLQELPLMICKKQSTLLMRCWQLQSKKKKAQKKMPTHSASENEDRLPIGGRSSLQLNIYFDISPLFPIIGVLGVTRIMSRCEAVTIGVVKRKVDFFQT